MPNTCEHRRPDEWPRLRSVGIGVLSIVVMTAVLGCPAQFRRVDREKSRGAEFDLFAFQGEDTVFTADAPAAQETTTAPSQQTTHGDGQQMPPQVHYRVQFFASQNIIEAQRVADEIERDLSEPVVVAYETPYYKVRAGWFDSPEAAERILSRVKRLGYETAWVVTDEGPSPVDDADSTVVQPDLRGPLSDSLTGPWR